LELRHSTSFEIEIAWSTRQEAHLAHRDQLAGVVLRDDALQRFLQTTPQASIKSDPGGFATAGQFVSAGSISNHEV